MLFVVICFCAALQADLKVYFIDVGQGDAEFVVLPNNKTVLIDGGPKRNTDKLAAFLSSHSVTTIDYLILSHPDEDHYGGLEYVFDKCQVNTFYDTKKIKTSANKVRQKAKIEPGCHTCYPSISSTLDWDPSVKVQVLSAYTPNTPSASTVNDASIVLKMTYKGKSILFTGDIDKKVEDDLIKRYGDSLSSTVLKVSHHGSKHGSSKLFLDKVKPKYAYIEVDSKDSKAIQYGHPDPGAISRLETVGTSISRTDESGTLVYTISDSIPKALKIKCPHCGGEIIVE
jgi:competence protein ComEC